MVSQYEGFGLPLLEAFTLGIPSIASNNSSLAEVARDAALLVDPMDRDSIAAGLVAICKTTDLRKTLEAKGLARAQEFSWERCARETLAAYRKLS
jgi:glycosyltransferase involved in cell wall biosynthesis